ncbi:response regulator transcription factor [Bifidobacterium platyrrhinorum]|nr:response regulator transcription factor [Bifidobacterium platyrrhinorum]
MRIAIVDDDPIVCQSLETILTATGAAEALWTANDGDDAVARYFASPGTRPDVLLIDIQMPGRDGLDAAREILERDPAARILFLTTFADRAYITQAMALGAKGYLIKQDVTAVGPALQAVMAGQVVLGSDVLGKLTGDDGDGRAAAPADGPVSPTKRRRASAAGSMRGHGASSADAAALESMLNEREREVAALVAEGFDNRDIAKRLCFSEGTVRNRVSSALDKLGLTNRTQLAILWINAHR